MKTIEGDLIKLALEEKFDVIIHGCNCFCTTGAGIAKSINAEFPKVYILEVNAFGDLLLDNVHEGMNTYAMELLEWQNKCLYCSKEYDL